jgi:hypothetical protein
MGISELVYNALHKQAMVNEINTEKSFKKNFRKCLEDMMKSSYLCNRFPKEIRKPI